MHHLCVNSFLAVLNHSPSIELKWWGTTWSKTLQKLHSHLNNPSAKTATPIELFCTYTVASSNRPWFETIDLCKQIIIEQLLHILNQQTEDSPLISCFSGPGFTRAIQTSLTSLPTIKQKLTEDTKATQEAGPRFGRPQRALKRLGFTGVEFVLVMQTSTESDFSF